MRNHVYFACSIEVNWIPNRCDVEEHGSVVEHFFQFAVGFDRCLLLLKTLLFTYTHTYAAWYARVWVYHIESQIPKILCIELYETIWYTQTRTHIHTHMYTSPHATNCCSFVRICVCECEWLSMHSMVDRTNWMWFVRFSTNRGKWEKGGKQWRDTQKCCVFRAICHKRTDRTELEVEIGR